MLRRSVCPPFRAHNAPAAPARVAASARAAAAHPRAASGPARAVSLSRPAPPRRAATGAFARPGHPAAASAFPLPLSRSATFWRDSSQNVTGERVGGAAGRGSAARAGSVPSYRALACNPARVDATFARRRSRARAPAARRRSTGPARVAAPPRPVPQRHPLSPLPLSRSATFWRDSSQNVTGERVGGAAGRGSAVRVRARAGARDGGGAGERAARARMDSF